MRSPVFWRITLVDGLRMGAMGTLGLFRIPYLIEQGVSAQAVAFALSCEAVVAALAGLAAGSLVDRYPARFVSAISTIAMILTFALTVGADTTLEAFVAASMFGVRRPGFCGQPGHALAAILWRREHRQDPRFRAATRPQPERRKRPSHRPGKGQYRQLYHPLDCRLHRPGRVHGFALGNAETGAPGGSFIC